MEEVDPLAGLPPYPEPAGGLLQATRVAAIQTVQQVQQQGQVSLGVNLVQWRRYVAFQNQARSSARQGAGGQITNALQKCGADGGSGIHSNRRKLGDTVLWAWGNWRKPP